MALDPKQRRRLIREGHHLKARVTASADNLTPAVVEHVRRLLEQHPLAKVRIRADSREECEHAARELSARVPCEVVTRVGRVVLLYREGTEGGACAFPGPAQEPDPTRHRPDGVL